jgi:hypothetical protein
VCKYNEHAFYFDVFLKNDELFDSCENKQNIFSYLSNKYAYLTFYPQRILVPMYVERRQSGFCPGRDLPKHSIHGMTAGWRLEAPAAFPRSSNIS